MRDWLVHIRRNEYAGLQTQIREALVSAILDGQLSRDEPIPSTRKMAKSLGVSRNTVVLAYQGLLDDGYLVARERSGYYVAEKALETSGRFTVERIPDGSNIAKLRLAGGGDVKAFRTKAEAAGLKMPEIAGDMLPIRVNETWLASDGGEIAERLIRSGGLDVVAIPTNRPLKRINHPDVIFRSERENVVVLERDGVFSSYMLPVGFKRSPTTLCMPSRYLGWNRIRNTPENG